MTGSSTQLIAFATPAVASVAVVCAARWAAKRWIPAALVAVISVTLGVVAYLARAPGLSIGQAIAGAVVAVLASSLPLSLYWAMGRFVRDLVALVVGWVASLAPLYFYALYALLFVVAYTQCGGSSGCPFG